MSEKPWGHFEDLGLKKGSKVGFADPAGDFVIGEITRLEHDKETGRVDMTIQ
jgi:hypothetical protein